MYKTIPLDMTNVHRRNLILLLGMIVCTILRHTLRDILLAIVRETSSLHKVFFPQGLYEVCHSCRSFPMP